MFENSNLGLFLRSGYPKILRKSIHFKSQKFRRFRFFKQMIFVDHFKLTNFSGKNKPRLICRFEIVDKLLTLFSWFSESSTQ